MQFFSTRDTNRKVTSSEAIAQGLSDEGGLFVPESFPQVNVRALCELDYPALAAAVIGEYLTDYSPEFLAQAARTTYGEAFGGKAGYLAPVEGDTYALELWHGPTCAFKDYALQLMPRLLVEAKKNLDRTEKTLILVATSGDTGKAALDGYHDIPGVEIAVFYPTGGTSEIQPCTADRLLLCRLRTAAQGRQDRLRRCRGLLCAHWQLRRHSGRLLCQAHGSARG